VKILEMVVKDGIRLRNFSILQQSDYLQFKAFELECLNSSEAKRPPFLK
jgi:hypothetical protein